MAGTRREVGLIFSYDERWIAGAYYIFNLVHALKTLPDDRQPLLIVCTNSPADYEKLIAETRYPYTRSWLMRRTDLLSRVKKSASYRLRPIVGRDLFDLRPTQEDFRYIFPLTYSPLAYFEHIPHKIFWIPDFQEHFYPDFFSSAELEKRKTYQRMLSQRADSIVFSSHTAKLHYEKFYPGNRSNSKVVQFAVTHSGIAPDIASVRKKYGLPERFFLCSNQFWMHKNHKVLLEAVALARRTNPALRVVFTGAGKDLRKVDFYESLMHLVQEAGIDAHVSFLGLIPREEQLCLLQHAIAVIQPSLFEGWSTIIEDAKALDQFILASSIDVHVEQLSDYPNSQLFDPQKPGELAGFLTRYDQSAPPKSRFDYAKKVAAFGACFLDLISTEAS